MAKPEEFTTKFKVDISELKAGIQQANRQIKLINSEFKKSAASMDDWSKSADGLSDKIKQLTELQEQETEKLRLLRQWYQQVADEQGKNSTAAENLKIKVNNQEAAVNKLIKEIGNYKNELTDLQEESKQTESAFDSLQREISEQEDTLQKLKNEYKSVALEQGDSSDAAQKLAREINDLSQELVENKNKMNDVEDAANRLDNSIDNVDTAARNSSDGFTIMKGAIANLVSEGIERAIEALGEFARSVISTGMEFEAKMSEVGALSGATGDELAALTEKAKEMGEVTKFSASDSADALTYMAQAGWKTEDMLNGLDGVMDLAAASGEDLALAADVVTTALSGFGMQASESARFADVLAQAAADTNTDIEMMGETFKYAAPVAGALGYSLEDTAVAAGLMANAGVRASQAGTSLRSVFTRLAAPPKAAAESMDELNLSITNADGTVKPLSETIVDLRNAFSGLSEEEQLLHAKSIAGQEAMSGLLAIVNASDEDFNKLTASINDSTGAAEKMATAMMDNLAGDFELFTSNVDTARITLYDSLLPTLREVTQAATEFVGSVDWQSLGESISSALGWIVDHGDEIVSILAGIGAAIATNFVVTKITAFVSAISTMITAFKGATTVIGGVKAAMAALNITMSANPIGLIITVIAGLVAAFITLWNTSEDFRNFWINLWENIKNAASVAVDWLVNLFTVTIPQAIDSAIQWISELPGKLWEILTSTSNQVAEWGYNLGVKAKEIGSQFLQSVISFFQQLPERVVYFITYTTERVAQWGYDLGVKAKEIGSQFLNNVITFIKELPSKVWTWLVETVNKVIQWGSDMISAAGEAARGVVDTVVDTIKELPGKMLDIGSNIVTGLWEGIKSGAGWLWDKIKGFAGDIKDKFTDELDINSPSRVMNEEVGRWIPAGIAEGIEDNLAVVRQAVRDALDILDFSLPDFNLRGSSNNSSCSGSPIVFNQYNNSPKALSRLEIYRQTQNQLRAAKGVV